LKPVLTSRPFLLVAGRVWSGSEFGESYRGDGRFIGQPGRIDETLAGGSG
jgi:hypothetical protein